MIERPFDNGAISHRLEYGYYAMYCTHLRMLALNLTQRISCDVQAKTSSRILTLS